MFETKIIREKTDLTFLKWSHIRSSSGTAGTFLKSESEIDGVKKYYKLSNFDFEKGVVGHESVNEIIADRLLTLLGVSHLHYELINADIEIEGKIFETYICASYDFKKRGESKIALDDFFRTNAIDNESHYDFCIRNGWKNFVDKMIAFDYIILNRDRHGANIEVLRDSKTKEYRLAPLFDHGLSFVYSCLSEDSVQKFDVMADKPCQNFIGTRSCLENLDLIRNEGFVFDRRLNETDKTYIFEGLEGILPDLYIDKIWNMIFERYKYYENI